MNSSIATWEEMGMDDFPEETASLQLIDDLPHASNPPSSNKQSRRKLAFAIVSMVAVVGMVAWNSSPESTTSTTQHRELVDGGVAVQYDALPINMQPILDAFNGPFQEEWCRTLFFDNGYYTICGEGDNVRRNGATINHHIDDQQEYVLVDIRFDVSRGIELSLECFESPQFSFRKSYSECNQEIEDFVSIFSAPNTIVLENWESNHVLVAESPYSPTITDSISINSQNVAAAPSSSKWTIFYKPGNNRGVRYLRNAETHEYLLSNEYGYLATSPYEDINTLVPEDRFEWTVESSLPCPGEDERSTAVCWQFENEFLVGQDEIHQVLLDNPTDDTNRLRSFPYVSYSQTQSTYGNRAWWRRQYL